MLLAACVTFKCHAYYKIKGQVCCFYSLWYLNNPVDTDRTVDLVKNRAVTLDLIIFHGKIFAQMQNPYGSIGNPVGFQDSLRRTSCEMGIKTIGDLSCIELFLITYKIKLIVNFSPFCLSLKSKLDIND